MTAMDLSKSIPELKNVSAEHISDHLRGTDLEFYYSERVETPFYIRLTMPFCLIVMIIFLILSPLNYIVTGKWGYRWVWLSNWVTSVGF